MVKEESLLKAFLIITGVSMVIFAAFLFVCQKPSGADKEEFDYGYSSSKGPETGDGYDSMYGSSHDALEH